MIDDNLITSLQNPKIKQVIKLRQRRERNKTELYLIEGYREIKKSSYKNFPLEMLFYCTEWFLGENEQALIDFFRSQGVKLYACSKQVFQKLSYRDRPDGLLGVAKQFSLSLDNLLDEVDKVSVILVAEALEKPGNLGTILRCCDAVGVDGLIICDPCTDIFNPNVVRASTGCLFSVSLAQSNKENCFRWLKDRNINIVAVTPQATATYFQSDLTQPSAFIMGTEQYGLSEFWLEHCDQQVSIPMHGQADSLNVAMATTVILFESQRQRFQ